MISANARFVTPQAGGFSLVRNHDHWAGTFVAMACPCEVLIESESQSQAQQILDAVAASAWRIEAKFSRYRAGSVVHSVNESAGTAVTVDDETANLLDFATTLTTLSQGRFDISSGVLRRAWTFDGSDRMPTQAQIDALLPLIGWQKAQWTRPVLRLLPGMQIDFGGIGKEYAVDAAAALANTLAPGMSCLVNFGGDVAAVNPRSDGQPWRVGVERPDRPGTPAHIVPLYRGGIATSGDSQRFVLRDGQRYSHILDARTGWPVRNAPHSVTVVADTCTQAGSVTTLAMLQGAEAGDFLAASGTRYWLM